MRPAVSSDPRPVDALDAAGRAGPLSTLAPGGFGIGIPRAEVESRDGILAARVDGRPLGIGSRGPLWSVLDPPGDRPAIGEEQGMRPWALFFMPGDPEENARADRLANGIPLDTATRTQLRGAARKVGLTDDRIAETLGRDPR